MIGTSFISESSRSPGSCGRLIDGVGTGGTIGSELCGDVSLLRVGISAAGIPDCGTRSPGVGPSGGGPGPG